MVALRMYLITHVFYSGDEFCSSSQAAVPLNISHDTVIIDVEPVW
jgi:hypothetical protein